MSVDGSILSAWFQFSNGRGLVLNWVKPIRLSCALHSMSGPGPQPRLHCLHSPVITGRSSQLVTSTTQPRQSDAIGLITHWVYPENINQQISVNSIVESWWGDVMTPLWSCHMHQMLEAKHGHLGPCLGLDGNKIATNFKFPGMVYQILQKV